MLDSSTGETTQTGFCAVPCVTLKRGAKLSNSGEIIMSKQNFSRRILLIILRRAFLCISVKAIRPRWTEVVVVHKRITQRLFADLSDRYGRRILWRNS